MILSQVRVSRSKQWQWNQFYDKYTDDGPNKYVNSTYYQNYCKCSWTIIPVLCTQPDRKILISWLIKPSKLLQRWHNFMYRRTAWCFHQSHCCPEANMNRCTRWVCQARHLLAVPLAHIAKCNEQNKNTHLQVL